MRSQRLWVVEFKHSTGWTALEGHSHRRFIWDLARKWRTTATLYKFRVVPYVPEKKRKPKARKVKR